jgi:two-component system, NarL family, response regulator LiaR
VLHRLDYIYWTYVNDCGILLARNSFIRRRKITTVLLADDHPVVRKSLKSDLEIEAGFKVVGEAGNGEEAVSLASQLHPDVVIMDIAMPKMNGIEATRRIKSMSPNTIVLVLTVYDDVEHVLGILESGADGYLTKNLSVEDIIKAIHTSLAGEMVISPQIVGQVIRYTLKNTPKPSTIKALSSLTPRELNILRFLAKGMSNKQIASETGISQRTVKSHLVDIFLKLNVSSRVEAVVVGLRNGFLNIEDLS